MSNVQADPIKTLTSQNLQRINSGKKFTHSFKVDFSEINEAFVGKFLVHRPSQMEKVQIGIIKSSILNGIPAMDVEVDNIAHIVSTLEVVVDTKPDWFDVYDPEIDYEILWAVFEEYTNWVNSFRRQSKQDTNNGDSK